jgi:hypothetical protein
MIHERYYSYIKNYQSDDGKAFMENVYNSGKDKAIEETTPEVDERVVAIEGK